MCSRLFSVGGVIGMLLALLVVPVLTVRAQSASNASWSSSITYYTPSDAGGHLIICYNAEASSDSVCAPAITLQPHKAGSLYIGGVGGLPDPFAGSAVLYADVPIIATNVQFATAPETNEYGYAIYSGFDQPEPDASTTSYIPTFLYQQFGSTSLMSIQNADDSAVQANVKAYAVGSSSPTYDQNHTIPVGSAELLSPSEMGLSPGFNGSVVVSADGDVVAIATETQDNGRAAYAFEGRASGANKYYMHTMTCKKFNQTSYYAIQNVSLSSDSNVTISFYDVAGSLIVTTSPILIGPGNKVSINPCNYGVPADTFGSAVIDTDGVPIIAMGKVLSTDGMLTAFTGQSGGSTNVAAPYVRWAANPAAGWRSYLAVMNVGSANATDIVARYFDASGTEVGSEILADGGNPLPQFIKTNTNPATAGALDGSGNFGISPYGGAVEITSDQPIVAVVRSIRSVNYRPVTLFGEDYNASPVP